MLQPGRHANSNEYRYGFNGKEKDLEGMGGGGSTYDYGFRIYNPHIGKFLSVDPLTKKYPWYTPYQFAGNMPIAAIDLDGLEEYVVVYFYKENKYKGFSLIHVPNEKRLESMPKGALYLTWKLSSSTSLKTENEKIKAFDVINMNNFSKLYVRAEPVEKEELDDKEKAALEGLKENYSKFYEKVDGYIGRSTVFVLFYDPDKIQFQTNSDELTEEAKKELSSVAFDMSIFHKSKIKLEAHTDNVGSDKDNLELSKKRAAAAAAKAFLVGKGVDESRISTEGLGETKPRSTNETESGRKDNRRVEIKKTDKGY